jgi:hypothetical protein
MDVGFLTKVKQCANIATNTLLAILPKKTGLCVCKIVAISMKLQHHRVGVAPGKRLYYGTQENELPDIFGHVTSAILLITSRRWQVVTDHVIKGEARMW